MVIGRLAVERSEASQQCGDPISRHHLIPVAQAIQLNLKGAGVTLWTQDAFQIGYTIIDELNRNLERSDFGVFVLAPYNIVTIRGQRQQAVRDNVVLELGMFIGRLGKERRNTSGVLGERLSQP